MKGKGVRDGSGDGELSENVEPSVQISPYASVAGAW